MSELETKHVLAPHGGMPVYTLGATLSEAEAAMILVHGRGSSAADIVRMLPAYNLTEATVQAWLADAAAVHATPEVA